MAEWLVGLDGDAVDRDGLLQLLDEPDLSVIREGDQHWLKSPAFEQYATHDQVWRHACDLLPEINSLTKLVLGGYQPLEVGRIARVHDDGTRTVVVFATASAQVRIGWHVFSTVTTAGGGAVGPPRPTPLPSGLSIVRANRDVSKALHLWMRREGDRPGNLYKVYEIIGHGITGGKTREEPWKVEIQARGWATADELENFRSVHQESVFGDEARHAVPARKLPPSPMSLHEAESFIARLLKDWLRSYGWSG